MTLKKGLNMKLYEELAKSIRNENFYETDNIIKEIIESENGYQYVEPLLILLENNPNIDYGMPGPVVHFVEKFYRKGYEELLLESINRCPTIHTLWMLNRILNDPRLDNKDVFLNQLEALLGRGDITEELKNEVKTYLRYQNKISEA